jgi:Kef-type K+ transport system membrane component KefB
MTSLVLQIGIIILCGAHRRMARKKNRNLPSVLGETLAGVVIGPYALGSISLPGFPAGLLPVDSSLASVSPELYSFATIASIILLSRPDLNGSGPFPEIHGLLAALSASAASSSSFAFGDLVGVFLLHRAFYGPAVLFLGILSTATSVGITVPEFSLTKERWIP